MKIIRAREAAGVGIILPHLITADGYSQEHFGSILRSMLETIPDQIFILQAFDDKDNLTAFLIAHAGDNIEHIQVFQATKLETLKDEGILGNLFLRLLLWADSFNRKELRVEIIDKNPCFVKRWMKRKLSVTRTYKIPEAFDLVNLGEQDAETTDKKEHPKPVKADGKQEEQKGT